MRLAFPNCVAVCRLDANAGASDTSKAKAVNLGVETVVIERLHEPFFLQRVPVFEDFRGKDRRLVLAALCQGKRVLHLGCADAPITDVNNSLHLFLQGFAARLDGHDLDAHALELLRPQVTKGELFSSLEEAIADYDVVLVPEVLEHVDNVRAFLSDVDRIKCREIVITVPDAYSCMSRHFEYTPTTRTFIEAVHPDHNCWYTPYTLQNVLRKYTAWTINAICFLGDISIMAMCEKHAARAVEI